MADHGNSYFGKVRRPSDLVQLPTDSRGAESDTGSSNQRLPIVFRYRLSEREIPIAFYREDSTAFP